MDKTLIPYSAKVKPPQRAANFRTLLEPALDAIKFGTPRYVMFYVYFYVYLELLTLR